MSREEHSGLAASRAEQACQLLTLFSRRRSELERIIASLTETIQTKEMQIDLMRDVNRKLAGELHEIRAGGSKPLSSIQTTMSEGSDVTEDSFSDLITNKGGADFSDVDVNGGAGVGVGAGVGAGGGGGAGGGAGGAGGEK